MKIVHVIESLDPSLGGPSVSSPSLASAQAMLGHEVTVISYSSDASEQAISERNASIPGFDKLNIIYLEKPGKFERIFAYNASKKLVSYISSADIVQLQGIWRPILLKASQIALKHKVKYVITPRGMLDPWSLKQSALKKKIGLFLGWRSVLDHCYYIHALNQTEHDLIKQLNLKCDVKIFPNGFFEAFTKNIPGHGQFYSLHPELCHRPYILFLSRLHYKKGLDYLADSFALFCKINSNVDLVVAGPDGGARQEFEKIISDNGISDRVYLVGPIYGEEKFSALVDAMCFCLPSRQEGFSMAILEALACSSPVVISEDCHFPEVAQARAGYVTKLDPVEISNAFSDIANDTDLQKKLSESAKKLVHDNYLWEKIAKDVVSQY